MYWCDGLVDLEQHLSISLPAEQALVEAARYFSGLRLEEEGPGPSPAFSSQNYRLV